MLLHAKEMQQERSIRPDTMVGLPTIGSADTCMNRFLTRDPYTLESELNQLAILNDRNCEKENQCKQAILSHMTVVPV